MVQQDGSLIGAVYYDLPSGRDRNDTLSHSFLVESAAREHSKKRIVVPNPNWKTFSRENCVCIGGRDSTELPKVGYFRIEGEISRYLMDKLEYLYRTDSTKEEKQIARRVVSGLLRGYIQWRFPIDTDVREHGVYESAPTLETVTYDIKNKRRLGIHIDSWDGTRILERQVSRTRFSVNLGPDVRHFLWVPYTVEHIVSAVHKQALGPISTLRIGSDKLLAFVQQREAVPVVRLELHPLEGYIADTDNLFHDASSVEAKLLTYHYTLRSFYIG